MCCLVKKLLEILKNHFLSSARFRSAFQPHYIAKKEMIEINEQTTTKVEYPYMPTRNQIRSYFGDDRLSNKVSKTLGYYGWADRFGLKVASNDTNTGKNGERIAKEFLEQNGFSVKQMLQNYPYDLLINDVVKADVKYSNLYKNKDGFCFYSFALRKPYPTCDLYILVANNQDDEQRFYIVPSREAVQKQISIGEHHSIYDKYLQRFDIIKQFEFAFKKVG